MVNDKAQKIPDPETEWEIWYQDTFDRECPRQIDIAGRGLEDGLVELWARHLLETVTEIGGKGFSQFNLWCEGENIGIEIEGEWGGLVKICDWIYGGEAQAGKSGSARKDVDLFKLLAVTHKTQILKGGTCDVILALAVVAETREDFIKQLVKLE